MKKVNLIIIAVIAVVGLSVWYFSKKESVQAMEIKSSKVEFGSITNSVTATGTLEPVLEVEVGTQVSGIINEIYVDFNDYVKEGQIIAEMDKVNLEVELEVSEAQLANSKTEYEYQTKTYNRTKSLYEKGLVSDSDYDQALYNYEKALNTYNQSQASMVKVKRNLEYATITSPINGVIISKDVEEGQTVAAGLNTPILFSIANDLTQMRVIADVDEADIGQVKEGQLVEFSVDAFPDDIFKGIVEQVRLEATESSSVITYEVVVSVDNSNLKLKPGLTANIKIFTLNIENVLVVPTRAIKFSPSPEMLAGSGYEVARSEGGRVDGDKVWVVNGKQLVPTNVKIGASSSEFTEIISGIFNGDMVATQAIMIGDAPRKEAPSQASPFMPSRKK